MNDEMTLQEWIEAGRELFERSTADERVNAIAEIMQDYCRFCGGENPRCPCENDE